MIHISDCANVHSLDGMGRGGTTLFKDTDVYGSGGYSPLALFQCTDVINIR